MAATAALASSATSSAMDIDENDLPIVAADDELMLVDRLASARIIGDQVEGNNNTSPRSDESNDLPTPENFFIHSRDDDKLSLQRPQSLNPLAWPSTPPTTTSTSSLVNTQQQQQQHGTISSCPRPSKSSACAIPIPLVPRNTHKRPLFASSSSGALIPPTLQRASSSYDDDVTTIDTCPATRAAAAIQALEQGTTNNDDDQYNNNLDILQEDISRQETFHTSHHSGLLHEEEHVQNNLSRPNEVPPKTTFAAYPQTQTTNKIPALYTFTTNTMSGSILTYLSSKFVPLAKQHSHGGSALAGFFALLLVTMANYMLGPMRDAAALAVGVSHIPALTLVSTVLALGSSVPVGWLFEAPDPRRKRVWKRMGLTRGETQGTSLALFYRVFAFLLLSYALGFKLVDKYGKGAKAGGDGIADGGEAESAIALIGTFCLRLMMGVGIPIHKILTSSVIQSTLHQYSHESIPSLFLHACTSIVNKSGKVIYIMFFLVVHLMKLHSLSLIWGVTTEAMEYEENAEQRQTKEKESMARTSSAGGLVMSPQRNNGGSGDGGTQTSSNNGTAKPSKSSLRLKRLGFVGFGGTLGGILGSVIASFAAHILHLSGLLIVAAILLELSANLSIELGRIMQRHWEEQMKYQSCGDLTSLLSAENLAAGQGGAVDSSMRKSVSMSSMKRVASGSLSNGNLANLAAIQQQQQQSRRESLPEGGGEGGMTRAKSIGSISISSEDKANATANNNNQGVDQQPMIDDNSFKQRLLRGMTTILRSRLLMSIFTYNALYASTSVLLSFQRAELVANRDSSNGSLSGGTSAILNTAFLAKINTASSVAVFALQASGLGAYIANLCGQRGALALMPIIRLCGVILLGYWHFISDGQPPDLIMFLVIDEFTKVINFAIAKPVRENLWRGLSAEARYEAKPIVDTLANRWGGGSAAFLVSFLNRIVDLTGLGVVNENNGDRSIFGFPPVLLLCMIISAWWTAVSADVGNIRRKIDMELKKQQ
eukprot:CAMPEP_0172316858 /NCGR_PEP_ID=MMETSP1058-20130122/29769_1 /TAXON_ID=83371 /ORGANISM="Detonula confervacea, Strain CCMP 353" /LENGTH=995 /DNA_ID=CAMNT_0013031285 /DNA_START=9 /DNA_END=2996 /DNA_ORIENTATION=-